jgi:flagellar biogenesis protein FliO
MAEQSFENHAHRPTHTAVVWLLALIALILWLLPRFGYQTGDWATLMLILAVIEIGWISRVYIVKLQDRIIMLEMKVRAAELLPAGADAELAGLTPKQITALRFAGDDEFGALLARAARENMSPKDIKAAVKNWRADLHRT